MPTGPITFLDLKKMEASPGFDIVEENVQKNPEIKIFPADVMEGTSLELTVRTDLPNVDFVNIGEGVNASKSGYATRLFQNANLDALIKYPLNLLAGKPTALASRLLSSEQSGFVEASIRKICKQTWYGVANDAKGFVGLIAQMLNDANHVIDAGGNAVKSSVFFLNIGANKQQYWFGNNKTLNFDDWYRATVKDDNDRDLDAMCSWMHCTPGFRLENRNSALRIKGLNATDKALTFTLMYQALQTMRETLQQEPTDIFMTARSQEQLRQARITALMPDPPLPKDFEGIPITVTPNISNAETI